MGHFTQLFGAMQMEGSLFRHQVALATVSDFEVNARVLEKTGVARCSSPLNKGLLFSKKGVVVSCKG